MEALELLNDEYGHCGECHEVHYIPEMVAVDGYYYCKSCSRPTQRALDGFPPSHRDEPFCECGVCMGFVSSETRRK